MSNTAALGLTIDSSGVKAGIRDLSELSTAAAKTEKSAEAMGKSVEAAGARAASGGKMAQQMLAAMERLEKVMRDVERSVAPLNATMGQVGASMTENARASAMAAAGYDSVARSSVAANTNLRQTAQVARQAKDDLDAMARAATSTSAVMDRVNRATGVSSGGGRREDIAATIQYGRELDALREKFNPLFRVGQDYRRTILEIADAEKIGAISTAEAASARAAASTAAEGQMAILNRMPGVYGDVTGAAKLTANQMLNLSRQGNDAITMFAMGATPMQVFASQAGQIYGALQEGPGGVAGSMKAVASSAGAMLVALAPLIGVTAAVAGGVIAYAMSIKRDIPDAGEVLKKHQSALKAIEEQYGSLSASVKALGASAVSPISIMTGAALRDLEKLRKAQESALQAPLTGTTSFMEQIGRGGAEGGGQSTPLDELPTSPEFAKIQGQVDKLRATLGEGESAVLAFASGMNTLYAAAGDDDDLKKAIETAIEYGTALAETAAAQRQLERAALEASPAYRRLTSDMNSYAKALEYLNGLQPQAMSTAAQIEQSFSEAAESSQSTSQLNEAIKKRQAALDELGRAAKESAAIIQDSLNNLNLSPGQRKIAEITQEYDRQIAEYRRTTNDPAGLAAKEAEKVNAVTIATTELARAEEARRAGYALDIQAIGARDAATKASIDAERTRIDLLSQGYSAAEAQARASETLSLSLAQSAQAEADSLRQRNEARNDALTGLQLEMQTIGQTAGETARLTTEYQLLQEAKRAAYAEGRDVGQEEIDAIHRQATAVGELTQKLAEQTAQQDILFERSLIGLPDRERAIQEDLHSRGIDAASANGEFLASQMRVNDALQESHDLAKDFVTTLVDGLSSGEGVLKSLTSAVAQLGQKMASKGLNMLFDGMMGGGGQQSSAPTVSNALGALGQGLSSLFRAPASQAFAPQTYAAPTVAVQRAALAPLVDTRQLSELNDNLRQTSRSAMDVAMNFNGLNEKANSPVLDSFMQASGTWGKLSAKSTAWCAAFANAAIIEAGGKGTGSNLASSFLDWGQGTNNPRPGDIVVLKPQGAGSSGHVGFFASMSDGKVEIFGGNQGNAAKTSSFSKSEVAAYRTAGSTSNDNVLTKSGMTSSVSDGMANYSQKVAAGAIPGVSIAPSANVQRAMDADPTFDGFSQTAATGLGQGMQALGAGLGIFASAYQSGSPVGGAVSGALGGWSAGAAIAGVGGPVGAVVGGIVGLIGGIFGGKSQKKKEAQARDIEAGKAWEQAFPKLLELSDYVDMEEKGSLSQELADIETQLVEFRKLAAEQGKAKGHKDAINNVATVTAQAKTYGDRLKAELRDVSGNRSGDLALGLGLDTEFEKARKGIKDTTKAYQGYIADVKLAFEVPEDNSAALVKAATDARAALEKQKAAIAADAKAKISGLQKHFEDMGIQTGAVAGTATTTAAPAPSGTSLAARFGIEEKAAPTEASVAAMEKAAADALDAAKAMADAINARDKAILDATMAARAGLLAIVSGNVKTQSEVEGAIDQAAGAASAMAFALQDLGMSAEEAGKAIDEALTTRMKSMAEAFTQGIEDTIDGLDGKSYLADFRDLIEGVGTMMSDANLLNVDTSLVDTFFAKQAQSIVDGAGLTGDAFAELIAKFPELNGLVHEFSAALAMTKDEIASAIRGYEDRYFAATNTAGEIAAFDRAAAQERIDTAGAAAEVITAMERALGAERSKIINDALDAMWSSKLDRAKAAQADAESDLEAAYRETTSKIEGQISTLKNLQTSLQEFLTSIKLNDDRSPLSGYDQFLEAQKTFRDLQAKALAGDEEAQAQLISVSTDYLDEARAYYASSEQYFASFSEVETALKAADVKAGVQITAAQAALDQAKSQVSLLISIDDGVKSIPEAIKALQAAIANTKAVQGQIDGNKNYGVNAERNRLIDAGLKNVGLSYSGNYGSGGLASWISGLSPADQTLANKVIGAYIDINRQAGGLIPGYVNGGMVGNGIWNKDSVVARYAGGGAIGLAGGEMVISAPKVTARTYPVLDQINRTGRVPSNDSGNSELISEVRALRAEVRSLKAVTAEGSLLVAGKVGEGNDHARQQLGEQKRRNAA